MRADFVDALFKTHLAEHPGYYGEMIWLATMLEQWLRGRTYIGEKRSGPVQLDRNSVFLGDFSAG